MQFDYERVGAELLHDSPFVHDLFKSRVVGHVAFLHDLHGVQESCVLLPHYIHD